jgi:hypothetical protein
MLGGFNGSKLTIYGMNKKILIQEHNFHLHFFLTLSDR